MTTKILGIAMLAAAMPAMAQFGPEYSASTPAVPKTTVVKGKPAAAPAEVPVPAAAAAPAKKVSKSQKISNAMQSISRTVAPWTPQLPEDDPAMAAAGYVPPQGKGSRLFRKGVRVMQGLGSLGGAQGSEESPQQ